MAITKLLHIGEETCNPGHEFGGKRDYFLLHIILKGKGEFYSNNRRWNLSKGDAFLIFPGQMHIYKADKNEPWHYFWFAFDGELFEMLNPLNITEDHPVLHAEDVNVLYEIYKSMSISITKPHPSEIFENNSSINKIMALLCKNKTTYYSTSDASKITKFNHVNSIEAYILENFNTPITVQDVIDFVQLERSYASRIFKDIKEISIGSFLTANRIKQAKEYLKEGWSAKETAFSSGFNSYNNFLKVFKRETGKTATEYKMSSG